MSTVAVIGGGASGMMAACAAAEAGHDVALFEHKERLGKKLSITGNGRCNLTNACGREELIARSVRNGKFLYSAINLFDDRAVMDFFEEHGLSLKVESSGRVFPRSDRAEDVADTLEHAMRDLGVRVVLNAQLTDLLIGEGKIRGIEYAGSGKPGGDMYSDSGKPGGAVNFGEKTGVQIFPCDAAIMATGGLTCTHTGSDGSGWDILMRHGHTLTQIRPALTGLYTREPYIPAMQGISLNGVRLTLRNGEQILFTGSGDLIFTHKGISGPLAITASSFIPDGAFRDPSTGPEISERTKGSENGILLRESLPFEIDLVPYLDEEALDARILQYFGENINRRFKNTFGHLLPSGMVPVVTALTGVQPDKRVNEVTREERKRLLSVIKHFPGTITGIGGWDEAVITRGGIKVEEVNPSTMESRLIKGLYLCGEMLDVDALTGGFNLQIAWSTGHLAGSVI